MTEKVAHEVSLKIKMSYLRGKGGQGASEKGRIHAEKQGC